MRADRLLSMMMLLQARGKMTTHILARELGVSRRTILRDVDALCTAGVPIYAEGGHGGGVALDEKYRLSLTGLKEAEALALFLNGNGSLLHDVGLGEAAVSTIPKLMAALPDRHQDAVRQIGQRIYIDPLWWWHEDVPLPFWNELQRAVYEDWQIRVRYEHYDGEIVERVLEPYSLIAKASLWYLVARRDAEFRIYRISRLHGLTVLNTHFERLEDFDLPGYWHDHTAAFTASFTQYHCTLLIDPRRMSNWQAPGRSEVCGAPDANGWLTVHYTLESESLALSFVFSLGNAAVVIEPPALRESLVAAARQLINRYDIQGS